MSRPWMQTAPASGRVRPVRQRNSVVLPAPLGPSTATNSPGRTAKDTPREGLHAVRVAPWPRPSTRITGAARDAAELVEALAKPLARLVDHRDHDQDEHDDGQEAREVAGGPSSS